MKFLLIFFLLFSTASLTQNKYLIYFKDKGISSKEALNKSGIYYSEALKTLSERAIERRKKNMGENFITYNDVPINKSYIEKIKSFNIKIHHELTWFNAVSVYMNEDEKGSISLLPFVEKIEPVKTLKYIKDEKSEDILLKNYPAVSDINYGLSFDQLDLSDIPQVHSKGITGEGVIVGFLDSGFNWKVHESLMNSNVLDEYDFVFNDNNTADEFPQDQPGQHNHGTTVFSVVGGFKDSMLIGAAHNASFLLAKTEYIPTETHVEEDNYAAALIWMEARGVDITSSSLGYSTFDPGEGDYTYEDMNGNTTIVTKACEEAFLRGVVTITSAGNEGSSTWRYITAPADGFNTLAIGAVNRDNQIAPFSSIGPTFDGRIKPEVVAMGVSVRGATASIPNGYHYSGGTSLSAPIAAGSAALLLSAHPHLLNTQVRSILMETAGNAADPNNSIGYGLVSAYDAIEFPNLQKVDNAFKLHKIFLEDVVSSSVQLFYSVNGGEIMQIGLDYDGSLSFTHSFPFLQINDKVQFYFTYSDVSGNNKRQPETEDYKFHYGQMNIFLNIESSSMPIDYILSQNFPNPFNNRTKINFVADSPVKAEMVIIDGIGQKIKNLFNGIAEVGINQVIWNGTNDNGIEVSSGVYYYILKLAGKEYGRKMIFLK
jgi:serine protease AprX